MLGFYLGGMTVMAVDLFVTHRARPRGSAGWLQVAIVLATWPAWAAWVVWKAR